MTKTFPKYLELGKIKTLETKISTNHCRQDHQAQDQGGQDHEDQVQLLPLVIPLLHQSASVHSQV